MQVTKHSSAAGDGQKIHQKYIQEFHDEIQRHLYIPDPEALDIVLATAVANFIDGDPVWLLLVGPSGGYYFWLTFPEGFDSDRLLTSAEKAGVSYRRGNAFSESGKFSRQIRLAYTLFEVEELKGGISRLHEAYSEYSIE